MSGICGFRDLTGAALPPDPLAPAMARLRLRGPDGAQVWQKGAVELGHTSLVTTPEAALEALPLRHEETGCVITADARLDNREALLTALGPDGPGGNTGDGALILRAYLRWGEGCVNHLLGDFAFAIWDPRRQALFCARDHMGMRQLIYNHRPGAHFAFATEPRALVAMDRVPMRLNEARVVDFLDGALEAIDDEVTFFQDVLRLPAAHCLTVDKNGLRLRRYWRLDPCDRLDLPSNEAYEEAFAEVYSQAVRCRLRSPDTPGLLMSGGIDSTSVAVTAAELLAGSGRGPLRTFSGCGTDRERVETRLIEEAMAMPGLAPTAIRHDAPPPWLLPALRARLDDLEEPFDGYMMMIAGAYMAAARSGVRVMLDGVGGDTAFSSGNLLTHALHRRRYGDVVQFARTRVQETGRSSAFWQTLAQAAWVGLAPQVLRQWRKDRQNRQSIQHRVKNSLVSPEMIQRHDLAARHLRYQQHHRREGHGQAHHRAAAMTSPNLVVARERYDRIAGRLGIEPRDPFCDIRLLTFCLSLPEDQLRRGGYKKHTLRRAMAGRVPDSIRWPHVRDHHGYDFTKALFAAAPELQHGTFHCSQSTRRIVRSDVEQLIFAGQAEYDLDFWGAVVMFDAWNCSIGNK
ncbi:asparagine synthase-related protein [Antarctobacter jejuensis]|uniref:asparagine synthase-related protein n=1 Tax=Antarctobacter jejuensis TaxID=1439938 RepID=UPI003FCFC1E7